MLVYLESFVFHYTLHNDAHADMIPLRYILKEPTTTVTNIPALPQPEDFFFTSHHVLIQIHEFQLPQSSEKPSV